MEDQTTILEGVRRLAERLAPTPVCDRCLADRLVDVAPMEAQIGANELAIERGFERDNAVCGLCDTHTMVTRKQR